MSFTKTLFTEEREEVKRCATCNGRGVVLDSLDTSNVVDCPDCREEKGILSEKDEMRNKYGI